MPAWLIPALKAVLPHVGTIITLAMPVFTKKPADAGDPANVLQQQITELQAAASQNAANIREMATQLQNTVEALHAAALVAEARLRRAIRVCVGAAAISLITAVAAISIVLSD